MNIGNAAQASGLSVKTIRYYEDIGLLKPPRSTNGYRVFAEADLHKLLFLARARFLGFSIRDCRTLLPLYEDRNRASADVKAVAKTHLNHIALKIAHLKNMQNTLRHLVAQCEGDDRPDCPILDTIAGIGETPGPKPGHTFRLKASGKPS